ncbi:hypothetical protein MBCUT_18580 [Methanobrevibacter cuticularis]|uniref:Uncharacterized protein n=1 Tax=Methanobrevibacter cuticularis TaxID=47311 RepID=A0A166CVI5_9EURY|nr:hypothetical protein [Methanobrevibacter cuticularis]KZX14905.1 hypothetical protein MBCUT_18580 [Methanobrevibacter cuticularis]
MQSQLIWLVNSHDEYFEERTKISEPTEPTDTDTQQNITDS